MNWKRRQARWPFVLGLGCLFALTLAAPSWWRNHRAEQQWLDELNLPMAAPVVSPLEAARPAPAAPAPAPSLPPLALDFDDRQPESAQVAASPLSGAVVESDDYVVIDEPWTEREAVAAGPLLPAPHDDLPSAIAAEALMAGATAATPVEVEAPELPVRPVVDREALLRVRDALTRFAAQARQQHQRLAESVRPNPSPMRVFVQSSEDRLAMAPDLAEPLPTAGPVPAPTPTVAPPTVAAATSVLAHRPAVLLAAVQRLQSHEPTADWAEAVLTRISALFGPAPLGDRESQNLLAELRLLTVEGYNAAPRVSDAALQSSWTRTVRALDRRLPVWQMLLEADVNRAANEPARQLGRDAALLATLREAAALIAGSEHGANWRQYLRLDELVDLASVAGGDFAEVRRAAARDVLLRISDDRLSESQRHFLAQPPLSALALNLRPWASGPVALDALAMLVERYELNGSQADADALAELRMRMLWSDDPRLVVLADDLNRSYRNANVRVALADDMFNRMIPPQEPTVASVRERIGGADVRGRSRTETNVQLRLTPDPTCWRMALEVNGAVQSRTFSDVGPARVRNASRMQYALRKAIVVDRDGLHVAPAESEVDGRSHLVGVESRFQLVPLLGPLVENVVRDRHSESRAAALAQVKAKVGREARLRMDREAAVKLGELQQRISEGMFSPLARFALDYEIVDMSTTDERAVLRLRMASPHQLAAHTPRPSAPSDSLASVQVHQSAVNNAIRGLNLDGRRMTVGELHQLLSQKFAQRAAEMPADLPQRAIVEFADHDAVQVACDGDCIEMTLHIAELRKGRDSIRNVLVHAFFRPVIDSLEVKLVRDGGLQFEGAHLRTGTRLVLHSVFGKLLRKDQEVPLLARQFNDDERFAGLMVTQMVIEDGWVALSVGPTHPDRTAWRTRPAAR